MLFFTFEEERESFGEGESLKNWKGKLGGHANNFIDFQKTTSPPPYS